MSCGSSNCKRHLLVQATFKPSCTPWCSLRPLRLLLRLHEASSAILFFQACLSFSPEQTAHTSTGSNNRNARSQKRETDMPEDRREREVERETPAETFKTPLQTSETQDWKRVRETERQRDSWLTGRGRTCDGWERSVVLLASRDHPQGDSSSRRMRALQRVQVVCDVLKVVPLRHSALQPHVETRTVSLKAVYSRHSSRQPPRCSPIVLFSLLSRHVTPLDDSPFWCVALVFGGASVLGAESQTSRPAFCGHFWVRW